VPSTSVAASTIFLSAKSFSDEIQLLGNLRNDIRVRGDLRCPFELRGGFLKLSALEESAHGPDEGTDDTASKLCVARTNCQRVLVPFCGFAKPTGVEKAEPKRFADGATLRIRESARTTLGHFGNFDEMRNGSLESSRLHVAHAEHVAIPVVFRRTGHALQPVGGLLVSTDPPVEFASNEIQR
jgi:hypothetical protein